MMALDDYGGYIWGSPSVLRFTIFTYCFCVMAVLVAYLR